jgi:hypothetical protein
VWYNKDTEKEREENTMAKFPINTRVLVDSTEKHDYYIMKCSSRDWYVEAHPKGEINHSRKTLAGFTTLKAAKECVTAWKGWLK